MEQADGYGEKLVSNYIYKDMHCLVVERQRPRGDRWLCGYVAISDKNNAAYGVDFSSDDFAALGLKLHKRVTFTRDGMGFLNTSMFNRTWIIGFDCSDPAAYDFVQEKTHDLAEQISKLPSKERLLILKLRKIIDDFLIGDDPDFKEIGNAE